MSIVTLALVNFVAFIILFAEPTPENIPDKEPVKIEYSHNLLTPDK